MNGLLAMRLPTLTVVSVLLSFTSFCQNTPQLIGYHLQKKRARIPFELVNNLIVVKGKLNQYENLSFIIDTGSSVSVIFTDDTVQLDATNKFLTIRGFGKEDSIRAPISIYNRLTFKSIIAYNQSVVTINKKDFSLDEAVGTRINGILGYDFFASHKVTINFITKELVVSRSSANVKSDKKWLQLSIQIERRLPSLDVQFSLAGEKATISRLILDTGADVPIVLNHANHPKNVAESNIGYGLMGYASGYVGKIFTFQMGEIELSGIYVAFPDTSDGHLHPGNLGSALFRQNKIRFDYPNRTFSIRFPKRIRNQPLAYDRSGLSIVRESNPAGGFVIDFISPHSIAEQMGLQVGDQIISIEKVKYPGLTLSKAKAFLTDMSLTSLHITAKRKGASYNIELPLPIVE